MEDRPNWHYAIAGVAVALIAICAGCTGLAMMFIPIQP